MINTKAKLLKFIAHHSYINTEIKEDDNLIDDLGLDELDHVELTMALEEEFHIEIPDEDVEKFFAVKDIIDYLINKGIELN